MATVFLSDKQRQELSEFPKKVNEEELIQYFTLSTKDLSLISKSTTTEYTQAGFALMLCCLRFIGFVPESLSDVPINVFKFITKQMASNLRIKYLAKYGTRSQTRSGHFNVIAKYLEFVSINDDYSKLLAEWLFKRALEYDRPTLLLKTATDKLKKDKIIRPPLAYLERIVGYARDQARKKIHEMLSLSILTKEVEIFLDDLLIVDEKEKTTKLNWLKKRAISHSPESILLTIKKIQFLREAGISNWDLSFLNANRLKILNRLGRCSTNQALQRSIAEKRYPILIAFLHQTLEELTDEVVDLFDQAMSRAYSRSRNSLKRHQAAIQERTNEKIRLLKTIGSVILDEEIEDAHVRTALFFKVSLDRIKIAIEECKHLIRPENDKCIDYFAKRFQYLRQFTPYFLSKLNFKSLQANHPVLRAIDLINALNKNNLKKVPSNAPMDFISESWKRYVIQKGKTNRKYYELGVLWELRNALRSGDIWIDGGRRYSNPEHYMIPRQDWLGLKTESCELLQIYAQPEEQLDEKKKELNSLFKQLDEQIKYDDNLKLMDGNLIISPLEALDEPISLKRLRELIKNRLPKIDLPDIVIEVDKWVNFSESFHHAGGQKLNTEEFPIYLYAAILAEATNLGPRAMAEITDLSYERIIWYKNWLIREETLNNARTRLINFQHQQELAQYFGDGKFSSSDGRRVPVGVKTTTSRSLVKYFAFETGVNLYSWTSDQYPQYGNKVTPPTLRESTFVLDAILDNETDLKIERHTTDTAGYTEIIFALFDLLGLKFEPRIKNLRDQRLYFIGESISYPNIDPIINNAANENIITENWDDILRLTASLKKGWVTASLFISKLQALPRKSNLAKALQEYGKIAKTISILRYALSKEHRREVGVQLNKGEAVHDLQQFLHLGRAGRLYGRYLEEQENHFGCLNLLINIVVTWNTVYMSEVISQLRKEKHAINEDDFKHLSPTRHEHINPYGKYQFNLDNLPKGQLRPLREQ